MNNSVTLVLGVYGFIAGLWPLVSIGTVQRVTGPIVDLWLVNTVGMIDTEMDGAIWVRGHAKPSRRVPPYSLLSEIT
jgi:hypothetical protein